MKPSISNFRSRFMVNEQYKVRLTDPADIEIARKLLAGEEAPIVTVPGLQE